MASQALTHQDDYSEIGVESARDSFADECSYLLEGVSPTPSELNEMDRKTTEKARALFDKINVERADTVTYVAL